MPRLLRLQESVGAELGRSDARGSVFARVDGAGCVTRQPQAHVRVRLAVDEHQQRLMSGRGDAVPSTVERVRDGRTHHVVKVHQRQLVKTTHTRVHHTSQSTTKTASITLRGISTAKRKRVCEIGSPKNWNAPDPTNPQNPTNTRNLPA